MHSRSHHTVARRSPRLMALAAGVLVAIALTAGPAAAKIVTDSKTHHTFGVVPTVKGQKKAAGFACPAHNADCTALTYHGGAVMHGEKFFMLFWAPAGHPISSTYRFGLNNWLNEVAFYNYGPTNMFSVDQQFYDNSGPSAAKRFVPYGITNGGQLNDTDPYPANGCSDSDGNFNTLPVCLTDAQLRAELQKYVTAHNLPVGPGVEYFIFTPHNVGSCFDSASSSCSYTAYCGYHSYIGTAASSTEILYANMPWAYRVSGCDTDIAFGSGYANGDAIDPVVGVWSHEASETMTDPNLNAWFQNGGADNGDENGDKCAYVYGAGGPGSLAGLATNGLGFYNYQLYADQYLIQEEWDQRLRTCSRTNTDTQPVVTLTPSTATHGVAVTFTAHVTDPAGVSTVAWGFGDGTFASTTTVTVSHTYATAGAKTLLVVVTDGHGNQKKVTQTVTVS